MTSSPEAGGVGTISCWSAEDERGGRQGRPILAKQPRRDATAVVKATMFHGGSMTPLAVGLRRKTIPATLPPYPSWSRGWGGRVAGCASQGFD